MNLNAASQPSTADFVTFYYTVIVVNNQFVITETSSLATTLITTTYNDILAGKQGDILYFDTSDPSNFGHKMAFFEENNNNDTCNLRRGHLDSSFKKEKRLRA